MPTSVVVVGVGLLLVSNGISIWLLWERRLARQARRSPR